MIGSYNFAKILSTDTPSLKATELKDLRKREAVETYRVKSFKKNQRVNEI
jgi:hypothetical protein